MNLEIIALFAALSASLFTGIGLFASFMSARKSAKSLEAHTFLEMSERYRDPEVQSSLRLLGEFWRECSDKEFSVGDAFLAL